MDKENMIAWAAGIFEGEGTICISKETTFKYIGVTSTDYDVLERLKLNFGGKIYSNGPKKKSHWKDAFIWRLNQEDSIKFLDLIYEYLLSRRKERCDFAKLLYLTSKQNELENKLNIEKRNREIKRLADNNLSHCEIGKIFNLERSSVTKILNGVSNLFMETDLTVNQEA